MAYRRRMNRFALLCLVSLAACASKNPPAPQPAPPISDPGPKPSDTAPATPPAPAPAVDAARLGTACGDGGKCAPPMECVKYYGIAGKRGGELSSCEIRCGEKATCPTGTACTTIADGPGAVCRPSSK
jgi:hypothetical protein